MLALKVGHINYVTLKGGMRYFIGCVCKSVSQSASQLVRQTVGILLGY